MPSLYFPAPTWRPSNQFINRTDGVRTLGATRRSLNAVCNINSVKNRPATVSFMTMQDIKFKIAWRFAKSSKLPIL
jgi:hypothetical protein